MDQAQRQWRLPVAVATAIALVVILLGVALDQQRASTHRQIVRETAESTMNMLLQRIVSRLQGDVLIADHLATLFQHAADYTPERFADQAREVLARNPHTLAVAIAPDNQLAQLITRADMSPGAATGALAMPRIDLNILKQRLATAPFSDLNLMMQGATDGTMTLAIPIQNGSSAWGSLALVIDQKRFLAEMGINPGQSTVSMREMPGDDWLHVAIRNVGDTETSMVTGQENIQDHTPLSTTLAIAGGRWEVMAAPREGWDALPMDQTTFRLMLIAAGLAVIVPIFIASILIAERNRHIDMLKAREANLVELSQRFNLAMETSRIGIWEVADDNHLTWDSRASTLHGQSSDAQESRLEDWLRAVHPDDVDVAEAFFFTCICSSDPCSQVYRVRLADGQVRYLRSAGASYRSPDGSTRTTGIVWDITSDMMVNQTLRDAKENSDIKNAELELALDELSNREQELEELSSRLDLALASYNCGTWESTPHTRTEIWDARMCQLYGIVYSPKPVTTERWLSMIHPEDRMLAQRISPNFPTSMKESLTVRVPQPDGSLRYVRSIGKAHTMRDGSTKIVGIAFDVTEDMQLTQQLQVAKLDAEAKNVELELAKRRIEHNALHDPLTLLANRRKLDLELDSLSRDSRSERQQVSILHLDLDRFKQINDTLGHAAGDAMLNHVAQILTRTVRSSDVVARIGGDEFVILVRNSCSADEMAELAGRIVVELRQPLNFDGFSCRCGVSIGIAQASGMSIDGRKMLVNADIALYRAKALGRNRYEFFTQNLQAEVINHKRTADELLTAIDENQFVTWYQPQFCAESMALTGVEALIRWDHPHRGILAPDAFLKIAEDLNVSATLDQIVLETVLKDQMRWAASGIEVPKVSVNVSSKRLNDESLIETLKTLAITPGRIAFELVESIFLDESEDVVTDNLERIKALGIDIEIDDFGTGHTSIVSLLKLKPKRLKIDRQLVMPIITSPQERALVRSIIEIAKSLGVETVAEGVETMQHAMLLRELGCDLLQGYAFARPLPFTDFTAAARAGFRNAA
ncbi:EAL domain-containing protein [Rhizobium sp. FY34]|uniref:bifunctional diguanylate cyclase/phosphodiesterase n=1 Tax=Rhizobium sp. FY34 TaxID=2562309 RepID=UPI0010C07041|nr:EAL domain-containing protein [Rhizobium sp. FY34]